MLIFPLKKEWYEKIKRGEKTVEYREVKPYWTRRFHNELLANVVFPEDMEQVVLFDNGILVDFVMLDCKFRLGYTKRYMAASITKIEVVDGKGTDLHIDNPVYAIHLADVKEI